MAHLLNDARGRCDFIVLDVPSFPRVADALVLSASVDGVVSVLRVQHSSRKVAVDHLHGMVTVAPSYCVVINDVGVSQAANATAQRAEPVASRAVATPTWWRWRPLWWLSGVILLAAGAAFVASHPALSSLALRTVHEGP
jgi:hypothetical protein